MCVAGHDSGPVFEEQPSSLIYPEGLTEGKVVLPCQARAHPAASYRCARKQAFRQARVLPAETWMRTKTDLLRVLQVAGKR